MHSVDTIYFFLWLRHISGCKEREGDRGPVDTLHPTISAHTPPQSPSIQQVERGVEEKEPPCFGLPRPEVSSTILLSLSTMSTGSQASLLSAGSSPAAANFGEGRTTPPLSHHQPSRSHPTFSAIGFPNPQKSRGVSDILSRVEWGAWVWATSFFLSPLLASPTSRLWPLRTHPLHSSTNLFQTNVRFHNEV